MEYQDIRKTVYNEDFEGRVSYRIREQIKVQ